jgi:putative tricarboxylic transport membrane protein
MNADRVSGLFWLIFALSFIYGSVRLDLGTPHQPGPGFLAFLSASFISLMALIVFLRSFFPGRGFQAKISTLWHGLMWRRQLLVGVLILLYILFLERAGFVLSSTIFLFIMFMWIQKFSWWKAILISACVSGGSNLLFHTLLKAALPKGIFGF